MMEMYSLEVILFHQKVVQSNKSKVDVFVVAENRVPQFDSFLYNQLISWLNENIQGVDIGDWTARIDYDNLFHGILENGIERVLLDIIDNDITNTIKCVGNKFQYFCVYHKHEWSVWDHSRIVYILDHISNVFLDIFTKWSSEHETLINDDTEEYLKHYNKIVPRNLNKIYGNVIDKMKENCKQSILL